MNICRITVIEERKAEKSIYPIKLVWTQAPVMSVSLPTVLHFFSSYNSQSTFLQYHELVFPRHLSPLSFFFTLLPLPSSPALTAPFSPLTPFPYFPPCTQQPLHISASFPPVPKFHPRCSPILFRPPLKPNASFHSFLKAFEEGMEKEEKE